MLLVAFAARAADVVVPNPNLKTENIPPVATTLATKVAPYTEFKPTTAVSWHPRERELIVTRRAGNVVQLHRVARPGDEPRQLTDFAEPVRFGVYWPKAPDTLVYSRDTGGNEQQQLFRLDARGASVLLSDANRKNEPAALTLARDLLLVRTTDRDGEFRKLAHLELATGKLDYFGEGGNWDVESIALSPDGRTLAVITNEAGIGVLRLYDAHTRKTLPRPPLPVGSARGLVWHENSRDLAVSVNSAQSPSDVYAIDVRENRVARWTETKVAGLDAAQFRDAERIEWKTFDGRMMGGF